MVLLFINNRDQKNKNSNDPRASIQTVLLQSYNS
jgi:hypothetical protein